MKQVANITIKPRPHAPGRSSEVGEIVTNGDSWRSRKNTCCSWMIEFVTKLTNKSYRRISKTFDSTLDLKNKENFEWLPYGGFY